MLSPDTVLQNRYRIIGMLGQGGMGSVYLAIDQRFDSEIAIKESHFTDEAAQKQFEREARLLNRLRHNAMTRVIDHFTEGDGQFLVMDYIKGEDLWEMLKKRGGAFPQEIVLEWADQLLDALSYLHKQDPPIIHRDIKPHNLKLSEAGQIILLDFGLAKGTLGQSNSVMTSRSVFGYTPVYAPLEQILGQGTDNRSDLYSLGVTLYHLLTGMIPTDAPTRYAAFEEGRQDPLRSADKVNPHVSEKASEVLNRAMAVSRRDRIANAEEMRNALRNATQLQSIERIELKETFLPTTPINPAPPELAQKQTDLSLRITFLQRVTELEEAFGSQGIPINKSQNGLIEMWGVYVSGVQSIYDLQASYNNFIERIQVIRNEIILLGHTGSNARELFLLSNKIAEILGHVNLHARPKVWHCVYCGRCNDNPNNDYLCDSCKMARPFVGGSATMKQCRECKGFSIAIAKFCEWCGNRFSVIPPPSNPTLQ